MFLFFCLSKRTVLFCCVLVVSLANVAGHQLHTKRELNNTNDELVQTLSLRDNKHRHYRHKERLLPLNCGIQNPMDRIYGGAITDIDEYPWTAVLGFSTKNGSVLACGGSIISERYVLTIAHCADDGALPSGWNLTHVHLGDWNLSSWIDCPEGDGTCGPPTQDIPIQEVIIHELYKRNGNRPNSIALLRLERDIQFNDFVKPICLPLSDELRQSVYIGEELDVVGWGTTETGSLSDTKRKVPVPVVSNAKCAMIYKKINKKIRISNTQLCAGGVGGRDSCTGDSGGPLMARRGDVWILVGIVSHGKSPCGLEGYPAIYTRVGAYIDWILSKLRD